MNPFPEQYELIGFFEAEPEVTNRDVPWFYNRLTFRTQRRDDNVYCVLEPGYEKLVLVWDKKNEPVLSLSIEGVLSLQIKNEKNKETLVAKFRNGSGLLDFELQLKPSIAVKWGNQFIP